MFEDGVNATWDVSVARRRSHYDGDSGRLLLRPFAREESTLFTGELLKLFKTFVGKSGDVGAHPEEEEDGDGDECCDPSLQWRTRRLLEDVGGVEARKGGRKRARSGLWEALHSSSRSSEVKGRRQLGVFEAVADGTTSQPR